MSRARASCLPSLICFRASFVKGWQGAQIANSSGARFFLFL
jgi:hypothetical protein